MKILSREEIERLVDFASPQLRPILIVALNTGMRKGEILRLWWNDVDFENQFISLWETKSNRPRKIPMSGLVAETFRALKKDKEFVFTNPRTGRPLSDLQTGFKAACRMAAVGELRVHDLRHTAATYMVFGGIDLVTVKEILGHATIQMTMRYAHPTPENKRKAVEVLANLFETGASILGFSRRNYLKIALIHKRLIEPAYRRSRIRNPASYDDFISAVIVL